MLMYLGGSAFLFRLFVGYANLLFLHSFIGRSTKVSDRSWRLGGGLVPHPGMSFYLDFSFFEPVRMRHSCVRQSCFAATGSKKLGKICAYFPHRGSIIAPISFRTLRLLRNSVDVFEFRRLATTPRSKTGPFLDTRSSQCSPTSTRRRGRSLDRNGLVTRPPKKGYYDIADPKSSRGMTRRGARRVLAAERSCFLRHSQ